VTHTSGWRATSPNRSTSLDGIAELRQRLVDVNCHDRQIQHVRKRERLVEQSGQACGIGQRLRGDRISLGIRLANSREAIGFPLQPDSRTGHSDFTVRADRFLAGALP